MRLTGRDIQELQDMHDEVQRKYQAALNSKSPAGYADATTVHYLDGKVAGLRAALLLIEKAYDRNHPNPTRR